MIEHSNPVLEKTVLFHAMKIQAVSISLFSLIQNPEVFYTHEGKSTYLAMQELYNAGKPLETHALVSCMERQKIARPDAIQILKNVFEASTIRENIQTHCLLLLELFMKRKVFEQCQTALINLAKTETDIFELTESLQTGIAAIIDQTVPAQDRSLPELIEERIQVRSVRRSTGLAGLSTGLTEIDSHIGGLAASDLIVMAGRPGSGKTSLAGSIMVNLCKAGIPVGFISLEMSRDQILDRLLAAESGVFLSKLRNNSLSEYDISQVNRTEREIISTWPLYIDDKPGQSSQRIRNKTMVLHRKFGIKALFIDYIQKVKAREGKGKSRENEVSEIVSDLKNLAKQLNIPIIALAQLNREVDKRTDKMPLMSDLRESGAIEQEADSIVFLYRPEYYKETSKGTITVGDAELNVEGLAICGVGKNRHGQTGEFPLRFNGGITKFSNY
jgi:replicative DNA helicase